MRVAYIVRSWPRLSQTFVLNEVLAVERTGVDLSVFAMVRADDAIVQPQTAHVGAPVRYLDDGIGAGPHLRQVRRSPRRYLATLAYVLRSRRLFGGYTRLGPFGAFHRSVAVADQLGRDGGAPCTHVHAHFAHDPGLIGVLVHRLSGLPFTFTAHARDLYQLPDRAVRARAVEATAVVTCCHANVTHLVAVMGASGPPIELIYHGVDLELFRPPAARAEHAVPEVVSVGRLIEKKGFDTLLQACARVVASGRRFRCEIYGEGPDQDELEALRDRLELADVVRFCEARTQRDLVDVYRAADLFVLTPRVTAEGDRDGVPNVLVEAMACGLPVVATTVGGIPELVEHGENGLLASADDSDAVAAAITELLDDASMRRRLGDAAALTALRYDSAAAAGRLAALFAGGAP